MTNIQSDQIIREWIAKNRQIAFKLNVAYGGSGGITSDSRKRFLLSLVDPTFGLAEGAFLLSPAFLPSSFRGEGALIANASRREGRHLRLEYQPGLVEKAPHFFCNESDSSLSTEYRGTLVFRLRHEDLLGTDVVSFLKRPSLIRNYGLSYSKAALEIIRNQVEQKPSMTFVVFSDRYDLEAVHFWGAANNLMEVFNLWKRNMDGKGDRFI